MFLWITGDDMAMTGSGLSAVLKTNLEGVFDIVDEERLQKFCDAAGDAIVDYIQANAEVPFPIAVHVSTGTGDGGTIEKGTVA